VKTDTRRERLEHFQRVPRALDEYMAAREWYAERSEVALAFVDSIERAIRKIRRVPRASGA